MITADGTVKVVDFGIAREFFMPSGETATIGATTSGHIVGTVGYMSPEQAEGRTLDARSDIFSFGSVLYEMIAGRPPFIRDTALATMAAIARDEPRPLAEYRTTSRRARTRDRQVLRKDPARRFQSMAIPRRARRPAERYRGTTRRNRTPLHGGACWLQR